MTTPDTARLLDVRNHVCNEVKEGMMMSFSLKRMNVVSSGDECLMFGVLRWEFQSRQMFE